MSINTLKRKTAAKYNSQSVGQPQFSLNGGHRSQGYIGQTMLSRSLPRTPMKGNVPKGHGGCCGTFPSNGIIQSAVTSVNDAEIIKKSNVNEMGLLSTKYAWTRRPMPFSTFKYGVLKDSDKVDNLKKKTLQCNIEKSGKMNYEKEMTTLDKCCNDAPRISKPGIKTITQSAYIETLDVGCQKKILSDSKKMKAMAKMPLSTTFQKAFTVDYT